MWSQLKHHARHLNIYRSQPSKVANLIRDGSDQKITVGNWKNYVAHIMKEEKTFREIDHVLDSEIKPLVIHLLDGGVVMQMMLTMDRYNASKQFLKKTGLFLEPQLKKNIFSAVIRK